MNDLLFRQKVKESGYKYSFISEKMGVTDAALIRKRKGIIPFKVNEINTLTELLGLTVAERDDIFGLKSPK